VWIHWRPDGAGGVHIIACEGLIRLNRVAAAVWEEIERAADRESLHRRMRRRYRGVDDVTLRAEIDSLLDEWLEKDWIARIEDPVFPSPEEEWKSLGSTPS
jgi:hypothetical protein